MKLPKIPAVSGENNKRFPANNTKTATHNKLTAFSPEISAKFNQKKSNAHV